VSGPEAIRTHRQAGVSVRRVEDITEALWGSTRVSPSTVSNLNKKVHGQIEAWQNQPIEGELDAIGLSPIVGLSGLCRAPVFGSTYAGGTIEELGAASPF
jgi:Transposase, Mutator family